MIGALRRCVRAIVPIVLVLLAVACEEDDDRIALDVTAVAIGDGDVVINLYNEGDYAGVVHGCDEGAMTVVEQWDGAAWDGWGTLNADCMIPLEMEPGDEMEYTISLPSGRYRFVVRLVVEGHLGAGHAVSNPVDV